ncbi:MAG: aminotransferase class IV [Deltaproteobacteria bacterium]|nr:aminotransferase class IV [Deltaproteobacteria bacterium]
MRAVVSIDGVLIDPERAAISVFDRGLLYGDGCFEVLRTWDGVAVDLAAHLDRMFETIAFLSIKCLSRDQIAAAVEAAIGAAGEGDHRIRIVVTRGPGGVAMPFAALGPGHTIVIVEPMVAAEVAGISVAVVDWPLPPRTGRGHKTLAYLDHVIARELARAAGADEGLRLDATGNVVECATSNVFAVTAGTVATPTTDAGVLSGIVRARVLAICAELRFPVASRRMTLDELRRAEEVFVTSSVRGVVGITRLDDEAREIGPITTQIATTYVTQMKSLSGSHGSRFQR